MGVENNFDFEEVWERICQITGWKKYGEMAEFLGIRSASVSGAKSRGAMPIEWAFQVAQAFDTNTDWLLTGKDKSGSDDLLVKIAIKIERKGFELSLEDKIKLIKLIYRKISRMRQINQDEELENTLKEYEIILRMAV